MSDDGFFTFLSRSGFLGDDLQDLQQRDDIAGLRSRVEKDQRDNLGTLANVAQLQTQVATLTRELAAMKIAVEVLSHVLVDSGTVDAAALDARIAEARTRTESARKASSGALCSNCGMSFLGSQLTDTAAGPLCKRCRAVATP